MYVGMHMCSYTYAFSDHQVLCIGRRPSLVLQIVWSSSRIPTGDWGLQTKSTAVTPPPRPPARASCSSRPSSSRMMRDWPCCWERSSIPTAPRLAPGLWVLIEHCFCIGSLNPSPTGWGARPRNPKCFFLAVRAGEAKFYNNNAFSDFSKKVRKISCLGLFFNREIQGAPRPERSTPQDCTRILESPWVVGDWWGGGIPFPHHFLFSPSVPIFRSRISLAKCYGGWRVDPPPPTPRPSRTFSMEEQGCIPPANDNYHKLFLSQRPPVPSGSG